MAYENSKTGQEPVPRQGNQGGAEMRAAELASLRITRAPEPERSSGGFFSGLLRLLVVALILAGTAWAAHQKGLFAQLPEVETAQVSRPGEGGASGRLTASGYIISRTKATLGFKLAGRIAQIVAREGTKVKAGDPIARLEDRDLKAQVDRWRAALATSQALLAEFEAGSRLQEIERARQGVVEAEASLSNAVRTLSRYEELQAKGSIAREQVDLARMTREAAGARAASARQTYHLVKEGPRPEQIRAQRARVAEALAALRVAEEALADTVLKAPFAGTVIERQAEVGETLAFIADARQTTGAQVVTLADLDDLEAEVDISENNLAQVEEGAPAEVVADAYPDRKYQGVVRMIMPRANRQKAVVPVKVRILANDGKLRPDMGAKVTFLPKGRPEKTRTAITMPGRAVWRHEGLDVVYTVRDGGAHLTRVKLGDKHGDAVEVLEGLSGGEEIVVSGFGNLSDGVKVRVKGQPR